MLIECFVQQRHALRSSIEQSLNSTLAELGS